MAVVTKCDTSYIINSIGKQIDTLFLEPSISEFPKLKVGIKDGNAI
ncbi:MAG: hypothetical protein ACOCQ4_00090 [bacterium]